MLQFTTLAVPGLLFALAAPAAAGVPPVLAPPMPFPLVIGQTLEREFVAPGVTRGAYHLLTSSGPLVVSFVSVDPREPTLHFGAVLAHDRIVSSGETISSMAARTNAVAGINADYFDIGNTNTPLGVLVQNGGLVRTPSTRVAFSIGPDRSARIGPYRFGGTAQIGAVRYPIASVNEWPPGSGGPALLTPAFGTAPGAAPATFVAELTPAPLDGGEAAPPGGRYRITQIDQGAAPGHPGFALAFAATPPGVAPDVGDLVDIALDTDPPLASALVAIGGGPALLAAGQPVDDPLSPGYATRDRRIPAAAAARLADGTLVFFVVDGRRPTISIGVDRAELIALASALGATDAMQFDSGGSATLVARILGDAKASVLNDPSDGVERPVADGLFVYSDAPEGPPARLVVRPAAIVALAGAAVPLHASIVDAAGHPLGAAHGPWQTTGARIDADGVLHAPKTALATTLEIERDGVRASVPFDVVPAVARITIVPERPNPDAGASVELHADAFDARGRRVETGDALQWSALRGTIAADGTYHAGAVDGFVTATIGAVKSSEVVRVGRHREPLVLFDLAHRAAWQFATVPVNGPGALAFLGAGTLRLTYDFSGTERAAYARAPVALGAALALSCVFDGDHRGAGVRAALTDRYGERGTLTFAKAVDWTGDERREARIPADLAPPLELQSFYVVGSLGPAPVKSAGTIGVRDCELTVPGTAPHTP
jgi:hypothetical protein